MLEAFALSDPGLVRKGNEDGFICSETLQLFVVADGMGGHSAGEVASRLAVETVDGFIRRSHDDADFSWPYGIDPQLTLGGNRMRTAVHLANRRVFRAAESYDDYTGMGTTLTGLLISGRPRRLRARRRQPALRARGRPFPAGHPRRHLDCDDPRERSVDDAGRRGAASDAPRADQRARRARAGRGAARRIRGWCRARCSSCAATASTG